ncbi:triadin [Folsomia candida]|uniref:Transcription initiation factor IIE subunit beta n=1 Tax=Folsomia candida TaxID=158441 RepID=A0A226DF00_FOLCA|nr:triadin [Folsomia candida]OXA43434.1 hypothetical protein Fcan01_21716 [Folsomia candida]
MTHNSQVSKYQPKTSRMMMAYKKLDFPEFAELRKAGEFRRPDVVPLLASSADLEREMAAFCQKRADSIAVKIEKYLRECFLDRKFNTLSVDELFVALKETNVHPEARKILLDESLPKRHPRIKIDAKGRLSYIPPYKITALTDMVAMIKDMSSRLEGLFEDDIHDSTKLSDSIIRELHDSDQVFAINRWDGKVTFFHSNAHPSSTTNDLPPFNVETELVNIFKSIDVTRLDPDIHIERYLERVGLKPLKSERKPFPQPKKKVVVKVEIKKKAKPLVLRHNQHVEAGVMKRFDENGVQDEEEEGGDDDDVEYLPPPEVKKTKKSVLNEETPPKKRRRPVSVKEEKLPKKRPGRPVQDDDECLPQPEIKKKKTPVKDKTLPKKLPDRPVQDEEQDLPEPEIKKKKKSVKEEAPAKKRSGRPVQDEEQDLPEPEIKKKKKPVKEKTSPKKLRGRPVQDEKEEDLPQPEVKTKKSVKEKTPPKKQRGRPASVKEEAPPKKSRGRPPSRKKSRVDTPEND